MQFSEVRMARNINLTQDQNWVFCSSLEISDRTANNKMRLQRIDN